MFLNDGHWTAVDFQDAYNRLIAGLREPTEQRLFKRVGEEGEAPIALRAAKHRPAPFYNGYDLYGFEVDLSALEDARSYSSGMVYALIGDDARLLDGKSMVIHELNADNAPGTKQPILNLPDQETQLEYLQFFCSFVSGEEGPFLILDHPSDLDWPPEDGRGAGIESFEALLERRRAGLEADPPKELNAQELEAFLDDPATLLKELSEKDQHSGPERDEMALRAEAEAQIAGPAPGWSVRQDETPDTKPMDEDGVFRAEAVLLYARHLFRSRFEVKSTGFVEMTEDWPLTGLMPVLRRVFHEQLPVLLKETAREVVQASGLRDHIIARERDVHGAAGGAHRPGILAPSLANVGALRNLRVLGNLDLSHLSLSAPLHLEDVEIDGDLILRDAVLAASLTLDKVRIRGRIRGRDMRCYGALNLAGVEVFGLSAAEQGGRGDEDQTALNLNGAFIESNIDLEGADIHGGVDLQDIDTKGAVILSGARIGALPTSELGLAAFGCTLKGANIGREVRAGPAPKVKGRKRSGLTEILGDLDLSETVIGGQVLLDHVQCESAELREAITKLDELERAKVDLANERLKGRIRLVYAAPFIFALRRIAAFRENTSREGRIDLNRAKIDGSVTLHGAKLDGALSASGARITHSLDVRSFGPGRYLTRLGIEGRKSDVLYAHEAKIGGSLSVSGATLHGGLVAAGANIGGFVDGDSSMVGQGYLHTQVYGGVDLSGAEVISDTRFCGATIEGGFKVITGRLGRVQLRMGNHIENGEPTVRPTTLHSVMIQSADVQSLDFYGIQVLRQEQDQSREAGSLSVSGVKLREEMSFFKKEPQRYLDFEADGVTTKLEPAKVRARIDGDLELRQFECGGDLDFSNISVGRSWHLQQVTVGGKLLAESVIDDSDVSGSLCAEADKLTMQLLHCKGDADLSGMDIKGDLIAEGAQFDGKCSFVDPKRLDMPQLKERGLALPHAVIGGVLNLSAVEAENLALSGASLDEAATSLSGDRSERNRNTLLLERAEIGRMTLVEPLPLRPDLADLSVEKWEYFDREKGKAGSPKKLPAKLTTLLQRSLPFNRDIYAQVERWFRDTGDDSSAAKVYRHMLWRSAQQSPKRKMNGACTIGMRSCLSEAWRRLRKLQVFGAIGLLFWGFFGGFLTGFLTRPLWLVVPIIFPAFILSLHVMAVPANITPNTFQLSETEADGAAKRSRASAPLDTEWNLVEQTRVLFANHVPFIPLIQTPRWELAENRPLCVLNPFAWWAPGPDDWALHADPECGSKHRAIAVPDISPASYALMIRMLHWVLWPLLIIGFANYQRRTNWS